MISTLKIAYKIGFSASLNHGSVSAYSEMAIWEFKEELRGKLHRMFCKGYREGKKISREIRFGCQQEELRPGIRCDAPFDMVNSDEIVHLKTV